MSATLQKTVEPPIADPAAPFSRAHLDSAAAEFHPLVLDRLRIIQSAAFRRLQFKTQVFVAPEGDHNRTRLTHTLEVANQARVLAAQLGLDEALAEVAALAHDLGHPPFGHAGERALDECLADHGGFEHNANSLRVVEYLEHPYPGFRGLNLTRITRECLAKHETGFDRPGPHPLQDGRPAPPEGQVAALADRLTYCLHDLQDGLHARLIPPAALSSSALWREAYEGPDPQTDPNSLAHLRPAVDRMSAALRRAVTCIAGRVTLAAMVETTLNELEQLLLRHLYRSARLQREDERGHRTISELFAAFVAEPQRLPPRFAERLSGQPRHRVICDYIAGMTDRFCFEEHARLTVPRS